MWKVAGKRPPCRRRWFKQAPPRDGKDTILADWVGVTITDAKGGMSQRFRRARHDGMANGGKVTYESAFVTSPSVTQDTVAETVACARARWKIENESFNVLQSNGCHLEHNFGHGKHNLAILSAALNLLAVAIHTVCDRLEQVWIDARACQAVVEAELQLKPVNRLAFSSWRVSATA